MTDARFPERWLNDRRFVRLRDAPFRLYALALMWSVANRTDGWIEGDDDLDLINGDWDEKDVEALVKAGLWRDATTRTGWIITDFEDTQTSRHDLDVLDNARRRERDKKRRRRAAKADSGEPVPGDKRGDSTRTGQARTRTGKKVDGTTTSNMVPCDVCGSGPSRINSAGARLCRSCNPNLWSAA